MRTISAEPYSVPGGKIVRAHHRCPLPEISLFDIGDRFICDACSAQWTLNRCFMTTSADLIRTWEKK